MLLSILKKLRNKLETQIIKDDREQSRRNVTKSVFFKCFK